MFPADIFFKFVISGSCLTKDALSGCGMIAITFPFLLQIAAILYIAPFGFTGNLSSIFPSFVEYLKIIWLFLINFCSNSLSLVTNLPSPCAIGMGIISFLSIKFVKAHLFFSCSLLMKTHVQ